MVEKLKHIISETKRFYILGITKIGDKNRYDLIELLFKDKEITIEERTSSMGFDNIEQVKFKKKIPVLLHIEGDNVINKMVENKTGYRNNLVFKANPLDFYFYEYHQEDSVFISIMRKSFIDDVIQKFNDLELFVVNVSFGPFTMTNLIPFTKDQNSISSPTYTLNIIDNQIQSFENTQSQTQDSTINGEVFSSSDIPLIAAFFDFKFPNASIVFDKEFLSHNISEFKYGSWFKKFGVFALVFILMSLFIGHQILNHYLENLTEKQAQYSFSQQTISTIENLRTEVELKEKILLTSGLNNTKFLTNYLADIGNSVVENITITSLVVNPTLKKIKAEERIDFNLNTIYITGESFDDKSFNDWVNTLKSFKWIQKIDIVEYSKVTATTDAFKITIRL